MEGFQLYSVGKTFPDTRYLGTEGAVAHLTKGFIDVQWNMFKMHKQERKALQKGSFRYGYYVEDDLVFILIDFMNGLSTDLTLEVSGLTDNEFDDWFAHDANVMNIFGVEAINYQLKTIRMVGLNMEFCKGLKESLAKQRQRYHRSKHLLKMQEIQQRMSTDMMMKKTRMYRHVVK